MNLRMGATKYDSESAMQFTRTEWYTRCEPYLDAVMAQGFEAKVDGEPNAGTGGALCPASVAGPGGAPQGPASVAGLGGP